MKNFKQKIVLFIILAIFWILWNNTLKMEVLITGFIVISLSILIFGKSVDIFDGIKFTPQAFIFTFWYIIVFLYALIKSNIDVLLRVISPKLNIKPGIVL